MSSKRRVERSNIFYTFRTAETPNKSEYDVSDNGDPEFVPRGCNSSSKRARSSMSMRASSVKGRGGKWT